MILPLMCAHGESGECFFYRELFKYSKNVKMFIIIQMKTLERLLFTCWDAINAIQYRHHFLIVFNIAVNITIKIVIGVSWLLYCV